MAEIKFISFASAKKIAKGLKAWATETFAKPADLPTKTSELTNDSNFAVDASYVHTDNNFTSTLKEKLEGMAADGEKNTIETVKVNGTALPVADEAVDISVPTNNNELTNGAGYQTASDVATAIAGKADKTDLGTAAAADTEAAVADDDGLPTGSAVKSFVEGKGYQTASDVETAITGKGYQTASDVATTVEGYGYQTASDVDDAIGQAVASVYKVKGSVATYEDLPSSGRTTGDVYNVVAAHGDTPAGTNYVFDGSKWDELGGTIDLSGYVLAADLVDVTDAEIAEIVAAA